MADKSSTFIFDKYDGGVDLFRNDREDAHCLAVGTNKSVSEFLYLLLNTIDSMKDESTLYVTVKLGNL